MILGERQSGKSPLTPLQAATLSRGLALAAHWPPFFAATGIALRHAPGTRLPDAFRGAVDPRTARGEAGSGGSVRGATSIGQVQRDAWRSAKQFAVLRATSLHDSHDKVVPLEVRMYPPKTLVEAVSHDNVMELGALYLVTVVATVQWLTVAWPIAMLLAPLIIGAGLLGLGVSVQLLWLLLVGLDRVGSALGLRKSPLA
jgi:hypothetical protein